MADSQMCSWAGLCTTEESSDLLTAKSPLRMFQRGICERHYDIRKGAELHLGRREHISKMSPRGKG
jgi:hypothetical protein